MKNAISRRGDAERAAEWYLAKIHHCIHTVRAVRTKWQREDLFGSDVVGKNKKHTYYVQVTAGQDSAVTARRRKLEAIPWLPSDVVELLQLRQTEDPANARRKLWFFRVHRYDFRTSQWSTLEQAVPVPRLWFKKYHKGM